MPDTIVPSRTGAGHDGIGRRCACYNLRRANRAVSRFYDQGLAPSGLRSTQFSMLLAVANRGPITLTALARVVVAERTTLTRNLALLERKGLIRVDAGQDRRESHLTVTRHGAETLARAVPLWDKAQTAIEESLGRERLARLMEDMEAMVEVCRL